MYKRQSGRLGTVEIAAVVLGDGLFFGALTLGFGLLLGIDPLMAQALGDERPADAHRFYREACILSCILFLPFTGILYLVYAVSMNAAAVEPQTDLATGLYLFARGLSVLPFFLGGVYRSYLQAHEITRPILWSTVLVNIFNVPADYLLGFGDRALTEIGLPAIGLGDGFGVLGIGAASTMVTLIQAIYLWNAIRKQTRTFEPQPTTLEGMKRICVVGLPVGLHWLVEMGIFVTVAVVMAAISTAAAGGHQVAMTLSSFTFVMCLGLSTTASVRVGHAVGRGDQEGVRRAAWVSTTYTVAFMACCALVFTSFPGPLSRFLATTSDVIDIAIVLVGIAAVFQVVDGLQVVMAGCLRGAGDTRSPFIANLVGHWFIGLPIGCYLAFQADYGPPGLWLGLTVGLTFSAFALLFRFVTLSRKPIQDLENH